MLQETTEKVPFTYFHRVNGIFYEKGKVMNHCGEAAIIRSLKLISKSEQPLVLESLVSEECHVTTHPNYKQQKNELNNLVLIQNLH